MHGGDRVAEVLKANGVPFLFTLCGGHISPILVAAKQRGIRIVDVRHEANAVFAADAVARLTGIPGVAAVTAGPGLTNTITALKNAQLAQSPIVVIGGATATALKGRGALQDIDQFALMRPHCKWSAAAHKVKDLGPLMERAFEEAQRGVPGPVFVEAAVDLLYGEDVVRGWYGAKADEMKKKPTMSQRAIRFYIENHVKRIFAGADSPAMAEVSRPRVRPIDEDHVEKAAELLARAERPVMLIGSGAMQVPPEAVRIAAAVERMQVPVYLSGMARGLLGAGNPLHVRHKRRVALKEADLVLLMGVPCDFRLDYGDHIRRRTPVVAAHRSRVDLYKNRMPTVAALGDPGRFIQALAAERGGPEPAWAAWLDALRGRDDARDAEIASQAEAEGDACNPLRLFQNLEERLPSDSVLVADGGDFVATASYILRPRGPLSWLDPGVFGTLGVGAGFALGAKLVRPSAEVWLVYGDGSAGYTMSEVDTFVRHGLGVISVIGNDASWAQIARDQIEILEDDVGTVLRHTDYHEVARGFGGEGLLVTDNDAVPGVIEEAQALAKKGRPVTINAHLASSDFRKGSIPI